MAGCSHKFLKQVDDLYEKSGDILSKEIVTYVAIAESLKYKYFPEI